jgi:hypothetical protein
MRVGHRRDEFDEIAPARDSFQNESGPAVDQTGASHRDPEWISTGITPQHGFAPRPLDGLTQGGKKPHIASGRRTPRGDIAS